MRSRYSYTNQEDGAMSKENESKELIVGLPEHIVSLCGMALTFATEHPAKFIEWFDAIPPPPGMEEKKASADPVMLLAGMKMTSVTLGKALCEHSEKMRTFMAKIEAASEQKPESDAGLAAAAPIVDAVLQAASSTKH